MNLNKINLTKNILSYKIMDIKTVKRWFNGYKKET